MKNFLKIASGVDVMPLLLDVQRQPELWNRNDARLSDRGPHYQTQDIWLRYKDETENKESGDYSNFSDNHESVWYPAYYSMPYARKLIFDLAHRVQSERIGGVLMYKVQPGKRILPHTDMGWHVDYYEKFNICLQSNDRTWFGYEDGDENMFCQAGDVHWFVNNKNHWVINEGNDDHIILTVCLRIDKYNERTKTL